MSKSAKLLARLLTIPKDFTWDELTACLAGLGMYETSDAGGSRRTFASKSGTKIFLHRPHPGNVVKRYALREVVTVLYEKRLVNRNDGQDI